ncbi:MAG TPA: biotin--[acetyl-CoA-carboxylase] ligase [Actinomycetota bacterium]|nr:biotin--[acetyl-CoA-carboxylase] ligase [Actinomycetota bacterium]
MKDLSAPRILKGLVGTRFTHVEVHSSIDSTQTALVTGGGRDGRVIVADHQSAGRGRAGRLWLDVPGAMLMFSALVRGVRSEDAGSVSLRAGIAVARALGDDARLKWPNDVRLGGKKVCGILGELAPSADYLVIGIGVNVGHTDGDLPEEIEATSVRIARGDAPRRDDLCVTILRELDAVLADDGWLDEYRARCDTIGSRVRVELTDRTFEGTADGVRDDGALIVDGNPVVAGDVVHLRGE